MLEAADKTEIRNYVYHCLKENGYTDVTEADILKGLQEVIKYTKDLMNEL